MPNEKGREPKMSAAERYVLQADVKKVDYVSIEDLDKEKFLEHINQKGFRDALLRELSEEDKTLKGIAKVHNVTLVGEFEELEKAGKIHNYTKYKNALSSAKSSIRLITGSSVAVKPQVADSIFYILNEYKKARRELTDSLKELDDAQKQSGKNTATKEVEPTVSDKESTGADTSAEQYDEELIMQLRARIENGLHDYGLSQMEINDILKARFKLFRKEKPDEFKKFYERASVYQDSAIEQWVGNIARERGLKRKNKVETSDNTDDRAGSSGTGGGSNGGGNEAMADAYADEIQRAGEVAAKKEGEEKAMADAYTDEMLQKGMKASTGTLDLTGDMVEKKWQERAALKEEYRNLKVAYEIKYEEYLNSLKDRNKIKKFFGIGKQQPTELTDLEAQYKAAKKAYAVRLQEDLKARQESREGGGNETRFTFDNEELRNAAGLRFVRNDAREILAIQERALTPEQSKRYGKLREKWNGLSEEKKLLAIAALSTSIGIATGGITSLSGLIYRLTFGTLAARGAAAVARAGVGAYYNPKIDKQKEHAAKTEEEKTVNFDVSRMDEDVQSVVEETNKIRTLENRKKNASTVASRSAAAGVGLAAGYVDFENGAAPSGEATSSGVPGKPGPEVGGPLTDKDYGGGPAPESLDAGGGDGPYVNEDYDRSGVVPEEPAGPRGLHAFRNEGGGVMSDMPEKAPRADAVPDSPEAKPTPEAAPPVEVSGETYVVQKGDNLWNILEGDVKGREMSEVLKAIPAENKDAALVKLFERVDTDPVLRDAINMKSDRADLIFAPDPETGKGGDVLNVFRLEEELAKVANENGYFESSSNVAQPNPESTPSPTATETQPADASPQAREDVPVSKTEQGAIRMTNPDTFTTDKMEIDPTQLRGPSAAEVGAGAAGVAAMTGLARERSRTANDNAASAERTSAANDNVSTAEGLPQAANDNAAPEAGVTIAQERDAAVRSIIESVEGPSDEGFFGRLFGAGQPHSYERMLKSMTLKRFQDLAQQPTMRERMSIDEEQFTGWAHWLEAHKNSTPPNMDERLSDYVARVAEEEVKNEPALKQAA